MRQILLLPALLLAFAVQAEVRGQALQAKSNPAVRFMSKEEAGKTLTEGEARQYYQSLQLGEMRAKTGLPLEGMTLEQAREATRRHYAGETRNFTPEEQSAIEGVLQRLHTAFVSKAPMYARQPWCFIKVSMNVEGGLPHTRGNCIVLSLAMLEGMAGLAVQKRFAALDAMAANLLVHEQTHVLQRRYPELFASLYTEVLDFRHLVPAPVTPRLLEYGVVNPDAPDTGWAYAITDGGKTRWIMPYLVLSRLATPVMPDHFVTLGITVTEKSGRWTVADDAASNTGQFIRDFSLYAKAFPNPGQAYHPNELSADVLAAWIAGAGDVDLRHRAAAAMLDWARVKLR